VTKVAKSAKNWTKTTQSFKGKDVKFHLIAKILIIHIAVNGVIVYRIICLGKKDQTNQKEQLRMEPEDNVGMTRIVLLGHQLVAPLDIAEEMTNLGNGMVVLDLQPIPNQVVNNPNGFKKMLKVEVVEMKNITEKSKMITDKLM